MLREGRDPGEVAHELGVTPTTLRVWLHTADGKSHLPDRSRERVIAVTIEAYERLDQLVRGLPKSALETPMPFSEESIDPWRVKDVVAHIAHYKARVAERLMKSRPVGGSTTAAERTLREYWDPESWAELEASDKVLRTLDAKTRRRHRMNHLVFLRWKDRTANEVLRWHRLVQKHVVSILEKGPDTWFLPAGRRASRENLSHEAVSSLSIHSDTHLRDIKKAVGV